MRHGHAEKRQAHCAAARIGHVEQPPSDPAIALLARQPRQLLGRNVIADWSRRAIDYTAITAQGWPTVGQSIIMRGQIRGRND
jgi:hypothetical protein